MIGMTSVTLENKELYLTLVILLFALQAYLLENKRLIVERHNVKKGDMIVTDIGSGILMRETRAYWFYLFKNRINRIKKSQFWQMVDCGMIKVEYADNKKVQKNPKEVPNVGY